MKYSAIAILALMFVSGCGGNGSSSQPTMTGIWNFSANSQAFGSQYSGTATIQQSGNNLTGSATLSGLPCATQASLSGTVAGTSLNLQFNLNSELGTPANDTMNLTGTLNSAYTSASGTFTTSGNCVTGDQGTWTATKQ